LSVLELGPDDLIYNSVTVARTMCCFQVLIVVFMTWAIPVSVFFTSIIGWQYFAGRRTVPAGKCYVQYMEDAVFNCILQVQNSSALNVTFITPTPEQQFIPARRYASAGINSNRKSYAFYRMVTLPMTLGDP